MKVCILGGSHAPKIFREAAKIKGLELTSYPKLADLTVVAQDAAIKKNGERDLDAVMEYLNLAGMYEGPIILTSQVPPGFCRALNDPRIYHQSETLRIKDALERAVFPEQIILGCPKFVIDHIQVIDWCHAFTQNVVWCTYEDAEFSKMAINMTLAAQVENTNRLSEAADKVGADWDVIKRILGNDKRIGPHSYLDPGDWQQSKHLLRDFITLKSYG